MDKFVTLEPTRLHSQPPTNRSIFSKNTPTTILVPTIGKLPIDLHLLILSYLPIPDIPAYARCSRSTSQLVKDERVWAPKYTSLGLERYKLASVLDEIEKKSRSARSNIPPIIPVNSIDDDFGDFATVSTNARAEEMGDFVGGGGAFSVVASLSLPRMQAPSTFRSKYQRAHSLLHPLTRVLSSPPTIILSSLPSLAQASDPLSQAKTLHLLFLFLSPTLQPHPNWRALSASLHSAIDKFDSNLLTSFDLADSQGSEESMRTAAWASWEVHTGSKASWELGKVWAEKREIFYEQGQWDPLENFTNGDVLDFEAMDKFMAHVIGSVKEHGRRAVRVFPPDAGVLIAFADRLASEVVGEYITPLLSRAREISNHVYLRATAATFSQAWTLVDVILDVASSGTGSEAGSGVTRLQAEDAIYQMFETNMDEYLDEETESLKASFSSILSTFSKSHHSKSSNSSQSPTSPTFLNSQNPTLLKRNVLASFTDVLLLPVTIVPRTVGVVGAALTTGGTAAVQGIAMLNPQRWAGGAGVGREGREVEGYSREGIEFEIGEDDDEKDESSEKNGNEDDASLSSVVHSTPTRPPTNKLELFLSLDIALELIHASRESLKRCETFSGYPGHYGHRVQDTLEEIFILMLQSLSSSHVTPGFAAATEGMHAYKPSEHQNDETSAVAPLLQFFELVHIGDTIQSMVQVYFDKELAPHIDKTDFLNGVVREKKRFENALDDSVAAGLNAGTEVLMNQVEHIILTLTPPRAYYPPEDTPLELGPTHGCTEAIKCLEMHCKLLKGSTNKEVLEVFYQEVGIRLIGILQKHIKRQIISLNGGFQVIADLNTYHAFIGSLKVPAITSEFSHLKMLGHVYVVEDAKDLAQIVRDVTRYGGAYRPEDIYEFIQRRSDWKKIERTVDKTMYNLNLKEDCVIC